MSASEETEMNISRKVLAAAALVMISLVASEGACARGGAPSIMDSPGYQRRLRESRQQLSQPVVQAPVHRHKQRSKAKH